MARRSRSFRHAMAVRISIFCQLSKAPIRPSARCGVAALSARMNTWRCAMPLHDWTRVPSGLYHHFHQGWAWEMGRSLNRGRLPKGLSALVEQGSGPSETEVLTVELAEPDESKSGGTAVLERPK